MDTVDRKEDGFELDGEFFRWHLTDTGKDLLLIDRIAQMPVQEFFEIVEDSFDRGRAPILLGLIATSIRAKHPDWSVERIHRRVLTLSLGSDVTFIDSDTEEQPVPPATAGAEPASEKQLNGSSSSSTPEETSSSKTSSATPA